MLHLCAKCTKDFHFPHKHPTYSAAPDPSVKNKGPTLTTDIFKKTSNEL